MRGGTPGWFNFKYAVTDSLFCGFYGAPAVLFAGVYQVYRRQARYIPYSARLRRSQLLGGPSV